MKRSRRGAVPPAPRPGIGHTRCPFCFERLVWSDVVLPDDAILAHRKVTRCGRRSQA